MRSTNFDLKLEVDFGMHLLKGVVIHDLDILEDSDHVIFDTQGIVVMDVTLEDMET